MLAIDDAWRLLRRAVDSIRSEDAAVPGACGEWSVNQVLYHIGSWEELLISELEIPNDRIFVASAIDPDRFNARAIAEMGQMSSREVLERSESVHRRLRDALEKTPAEWFDSGHPNRRSVDEWAYLHYEEHTAQIAAWAQETRAPN